MGDRQITVLSPAVQNRHAGRRACFAFFVYAFFFRSRISAVNTAVSGTARMTPILLAMLLTASVAR